MSLVGEEQKALAQNLANRVDRPGEPGAVGGDDERALDKNRVLDHRVEQFVVAGLGEVQLVVQRLPLADGLADVNPCVLDHLYQLGARRRRLEVLDDFRLDAVVPQQVQGLA